MAESPLPLECLRIIIQHLYNSKDTPSLVTLLCVNRFFANATLPILYSDPYDLISYLKSSSSGIFYTSEGMPEFRDSRRQRNTTLLTRTLLRQVPPEATSELVRAVYFTKQDFDGDYDPWPTAPAITTTTTTTAPTSTPTMAPAVAGSAQSASSYTPILHYLPHVIHFPTDKFARWGPNNRRLSHYIKKTKFFDRSRELDLYRASYNAGSHRWRFDDPLLIQELDRELLWALCVPESTRSLSILVSDVSRYLDRVERFTALESLKFLIDKDLFVHESYGLSLPPDEKVLEDARRVELGRCLELAVEFVKEHARIHKGVLLKAIILTPLCLGIHLHSIQQRMTKYLPLVHNPTSLVYGTRDYFKFLYSSEDINLHYLESFSNWGCYSKDNAILNTLPPFLHRCRALKSVKMILFGEDQFAWAAQERRDYEVQLTKNQDDTPKLSLVPVKEVTLQFGGQIRGQPIDSIAHGFCNTLESYDMAGWRKFLHRHLEPAVFGKGWNLPRLHTLVATTSKGRLTIHPDALSGCPALETLTLEDSVNIYTADEIPSWSPAHLPRVTSLKLGGTMTRLFHPDTLHSTSCLEVLTLTHDSTKLHEREYDYDDLDAVGEYPSEEEDEDEDWEEPITPSLHPDLNHLCLLGQQQQEGWSGLPSPTTTLTTTPLTRPKWTWDWHLPHLRQLDLCGEFAFFFQFRMLRHTPSLASLHLENRTPEGQYERTVTVDELRNTNGGEDTGFINLPHLNRFLLVARWTIGPQFWQTLFGKVMPAVESLREDKCIGYTLQDWFEATTSLKKLRYAGSMLKVEDKAVPLSFGLSELNFGLLGHVEGCAMFYFRYVSKLAPGCEEEDPYAVRIYDPDSCQYLRLPSSSWK
ncbi:hypothetical protein BGZ95_011360 [Linnemannia exigua]|uniref:F-box domain-containing protein n=1 Tax=Linnemannia exigua TaxID=604196 RepID=A0AAD4H4B2_9FUNG|nr:hypothetical protein BGZ95_011360 [Linnemannia exigua]